MHRTINWSSMKPGDVIVQDCGLQRVLEPSGEYDEAGHVIYVPAPGLHHRLHFAGICTHKRPCSASYGSVGGHLEAYSEVPEGLPSAGHQATAEAFFTEFFAHNQEPYVGDTNAGL